MYEDDADFTNTFRALGSITTAGEDELPASLAEVRARDAVQLPSNSASSAGRSQRCTLSRSTSPCSPQALRVLRSLIPCYDYLLLCTVGRCSARRLPVQHPRYMK